MTMWIDQWRELGLVLGLAACALVISEPAASLPSATGVWKQVDEQGKVGALVTISEQDGVYVGRLSKLFLDPSEDPNPLCTKCPGDKLNQPVLGLTFIEGMKQSGLDYEDGTILDPETGDIYHAKMRLSADGNELNVRGYVGLAVFGRTQTWTRVE